MKKFWIGVGLLLGMAAPLLAQDEGAAPAPPAEEVEKPAAGESPSTFAQAAALATPAVKAPKKKSLGDEAGIKKAFQGFSQVWATGDVRKVIKFFTYDSTLVNPMGRMGWGREEVEKVIADDLRIFKGTTQTFDNFKMIFVLYNLALVDCDATLRGMKTPSGADAGEQKFHVYSVIVNRGKAWQARAIRVASLLKLPAETSQEPPSPPVVGPAVPEPPMAGVPAAPSAAVPPAPTVEKAASPSPAVSVPPPPLADEPSVPSPPIAAPPAPASTPVPAAPPAPVISVPSSVEAPGAVPAAPEIVTPTPEPSDTK